MPYTTSGDIKIYFHAIGDIGNSDKPTLIFLHGGAGIADHSLYLPFWSKLSSQANIILIDQRGCGQK